MKRCMTRNGVVHIVAGYWQVGEGDIVLNCLHVGGLVYFKAYPEGHPKLKTEVLVVTDADDQPVTCMECIAEGDT
jgi:hypothetical protein